MNLNDLRPAFFRFDGGRPYGGWVSPNGDYWAAEDTRDEAVGELREGNGKPIAVELALALPNEHGLILMKHARSALDTGECLEFSAEVDLRPTDYIDAGERCVAVRNCKASGAVELFMHYYHKRLEQWSNCVTFEPHTSNEYLRHMRLLRGAASP